MVYDFCLVGSPLVHVTLCHCTMFCAFGKAFFGILPLYVPTSTSWTLDISCYKIVKVAYFGNEVRLLINIYLSLQEEKKMNVYSKIVVAFKKYPLLRGMASYGVIWPISSLIQQTFEGKDLDSYDWLRCARYGVYGSCYVAPTLYSWLTVANVIWPGSTIRAGVIKTFVETITYTPFAMCSFYFGMSILEMKPFYEAVAEVEAKFWPTYKVGASIWPAVAMVNFCLIPPRNRVPFISMCSLVWTCFLAYMKHLDKEKVAAKAGQSPVQLMKMNI